jgi:hypothetical protein
MLEVELAFVAICVSLTLNACTTSSVLVVANSLTFTLVSVFEGKKQSQQLTTRAVDLEDTRHLLPGLPTSSAYICRGTRGHRVLLDPLGLLYKLTCI